MSWSTDAAGPFACDTCYGELAIDGVSMHTSAWCLPDLSPLWSSFELRGQNRVIPGRRGRKPYPRRVDETRLSLPMLVTGYCDAAGTPYSEGGTGYSDIYDDVYEHGPAISYPAGLETNIAYLQDLFNLCDPTETVNSLHTATFTLPSGAVRESQVQILGLVGALRPGYLFRATLDLLDVDGDLMVCRDIA